MTHRNAVLTPQDRYRLVMRVQAGRPIAHVAAEAGIARATLSKWLARYHQGGTQALEDRSSAPAHRPTRTSAKTVDLIEHWRRAHKWSARRISHELAARDSGVGTHRDPLAGQSRPEPTPRHRSHRAVQPGRQTHRGPLPGPHDPPGRQEGRTHPTRKEAGGPTGEEPPRPQPPNEARQPGSATPTYTPPSTASPARPTPRPSTTRRPPPRSASSAAPAPSWPPTASPGSCESSPTTGPTTAPRPSPRPSPPWPHATRGSAPAPHGTTARPSAATASWPRSASTPAPTPQSSSTATPSRCGATTTTTIDPTPPATTSHPRPNTRHQRHDLIQLALIFRRSGP